MAKHDHFCGKCQWRTTDDTFERICPRCGEQTAIVSAPAVKNFKPFWHPNLGHEPVHIDSSKTLDRELKARNLDIKVAPKNERRVRLPQSKAEALNV